MEVALLENPGYSPEGRRVPVLICDCGTEGCGDVTALITIGADTVTWRDIRLPGDDAGLPTVGPYVFSRAEYELALSGH